MLLVIIGHTGCSWPIYESIYAFHMPLFFLVSGLFFSTKKSVMQGVKLECKRILVPYFEICLVTTLSLFLLGEHYECFVRSFIKGTHVPNDYRINFGPIWFLLALFWCRIIYRVLSEYINIKWRTIIISLVVFTILTINLCISDEIYKFPMNFLQGVVCMFYYHVGILLKENKGIEVLRSWNRSRKFMFLIISAFLLLVSVIFYRRMGSNMNLSILNAPLLPIDFLNAICLTLSLYLIICFVSNNFVRLRPVQYFLRWCGEKSMSIFAVHCVEYHTTVRIISRQVEFLKPISNNLIETTLISVINPVTQIVIAVFLVWLWQNVCRLVENHYSKGIR